MKKIIFSWLLSFIFLSTGQAQYHTSTTGYDGDYFSLEGALHMFKESSTLRKFERKINSKNNWVNNLDLNYDGKIDYIRVNHRQRGAFHAIVLQALVGRYETQDVAVIEIEILRRGEAVLQIVGDEDIFGENVVIEPVIGTANRRTGYHRDYGDFVNVYYWDLVQNIRRDQYSTYSSPYRWNYYPVWWNPWRPYSWNQYRARNVYYYDYYRLAPRHRVIRVHNFYRPNRSYCPSVADRANRNRVNRGRSQVYRSSPKRNDNWNSNTNQRNRITENNRRSSGSTIYSRKQRENSTYNKNRTRSYPKDNNIKTRTPQTNPKSRNSNSGTRIDRSRSIEKRPSVSRRNQSSTVKKTERSNQVRQSQIKRSPNKSINRSKSTSRSRKSG